MSNIIKIKDYKRSNYSFATKAVLIKTEEGSFRTYQLIVLLSDDNKEIYTCTGLERYVINMGKELSSETTYTIACSRVKDFLNYILKHTDIKKISDISVNDIREFLKYKKTKENGTEIKKDSWEKTRKDVYRFLINYYEANNCVIKFNYSPSDLQEVKSISGRADFRNRTVTSEKSLNVKPPNTLENKKRGRAIWYGHLEVILYLAKIYDPMIYFAISLMAYAGLREGETANLAFKDIALKKSVGVTNKIRIELKKSDQFRKGKSHTGVIKKFREQDVYTDFIDEAEKAYEFHIELLKGKGLGISQESAVFYNKQGEPMSERSLRSRIKELFEGYFLKALEDTSTDTNFEGETAAYIYQYQNEYPGAHMFRHWFTMYLITKAELTPEEVRKWRGDAPDSNSYEQYIHVNADLIEEYRNSAYVFQRNIMEDIYD